jgi:hypothetical protein
MKFTAKIRYFEMVVEKKYLQIVCLTSLKVVFFGQIKLSGDTMGERIGQIGRIDTDFSCHSVRIFERFLRNEKKSVSIRPICPIRSPIVSQLTTKPNLKKSYTRAKNDPYAKSFFLHFFRGNVASSDFADRATAQ